MDPLTATQVMRIWERCRAVEPTRRALAILAEADGGTSAEELAELPICERDRQLFTLRRATFGPEYEALTTCRSCGENLEIRFTGDDLEPANEARERSIPRLSVGALALRVRLPNTRDIDAAARCADTASARSTLASRCIETVEREGEPISLESIPEDLVAHVARHLEAADRGGDITLRAMCPSCDERSEPGFDIASYFFAEIEREAVRLLGEVHGLAQGYGWREVDILAMTPVRRRAYLEMLNA